MNEQERRDYRQALAAMQERTAALDDLISRAAPDLARVIVAMSTLAEHDRRFDELVAWVHGGPRPAVTAGAQAILTRQAQETR